MTMQRDQQSCNAVFSTTPMGTKLSSLFRRRKRTKAYHLAKRLKEEKVNLAYMVNFEMLASL